MECFNGIPNEFHQIHYQTCHASNIYRLLNPCQLWQTTLHLHTFRRERLNSFLQRLQSWTASSSIQDPGFLLALSCSFNESISSLALDKWSPSSLIVFSSCRLVWLHFSLSCFKFSTSCILTRNAFSCCSRMITVYVLLWLLSADVSLPPFEGKEPLCQLQTVSAVVASIPFQFWGQPPVDTFFAQRSAMIL